MATTTAEVSATPASHLLDDHGIVVDGVSRSDIEARLSSGSFFWLDLPRLGTEEVSWLRDLFHFHPLAIEDAEQFGERPKLEEFDDYTFLVLHGSALDFDNVVFGVPDDPPPPVSPGTLDDLSEVHFFVANRYMVTVHRGTCPSLRHLARRMKSARVGVVNPARLFHRVADTLVDSFFPVLSTLDEGVDALQDAIIARPRQEQLVRLLEYRSTLVGLRKVVAPQRDIFAGLAGGITELPGFDEDAQPYFRDIYDHLIRLADMVDGYRDLVSGVTDAYISVTSNQLNVVMKQLTIISTIFLPLSFLTGFFGQNFGYLVRNIGGWETFFGVGLGTELIAVVALLWLFRSRGWLWSKS
ncbi:MAG: magnesium transporter CorA family protein [Acidimicrobiaceae bacterium]|nr:magnesium transporter CorA family protein [Acidimicrobiaceae bacterium]